MLSMSVTGSVSPFATMPARTPVALWRKTHLLCIMFCRCCDAGVSMCTSLYTFCCFICCISFFMPCVANCLSSPSVSLMIGSKRIISVVCSLVPSLEHAAISLPFFFSIVIAVIRSLDVDDSALASGLVRPVGASSPRVCFDDETSSMSSGSVRFGDDDDDDGNAGVLHCCHW